MQSCLQEMQSFLGVVPEAEYSILQEDIEVYDVRLGKKIAGQKFSRLVKIIR